MSWDNWTVFIDNNGPRVLGIGSNVLGTISRLHSQLDGAEDPEAWSPVGDQIFADLRELTPNHHIDSLSVCVKGWSGLGWYVCGCTYRLEPCPDSGDRLGDLMESVFPNGSVKVWRYSFERRLRDYIVSQVRHNNAIQLDRIVEILKR